MTDPQAAQIAALVDEASRKIFEADDLLSKASSRACHLQGMDEMRAKIRGMLTLTGWHIDGDEDMPAEVARAIRSRGGSITEIEGNAAA